MRAEKGACDQHARISTPYRDERCNVIIASKGGPGPAAKLNPDPDKKHNPKPEVYGVRI